LDRHALEVRNQLMAKALHSTPFKHRLRRLLIHAIAHLPIPIQKTINPSQRILLVSPDHLGDMLLTTPAIHALRKAQPDAEIHALVGSWSAPLVADCTEVDFILTLPFPGFTRNRKQRGLFSTYRILLQSTRQLRRIGYTSAVILHPNHWWGALLAYLAGIPNRFGHDLPDVAPLLTHATPYKQQHAIIQSLRLVNHWTGNITPENVRYKYTMLNEDHDYIDNCLKKREITPQDKVFCIHPGAGAQVKKWDSIHWAIVADTLIDQWGAKAIFTGCDSELPLVQSITSHMEHPAINMVGETQIGQLAALYTRSCIVIGPDSDPLHIAAAVGTPTVSLFGPADPIECSPWGQNEKHIVLTSKIRCRPCRIFDWGEDNLEFHPCVRDIQVGQVLDAAWRIANRER
jgi:lipopolysaccharide heptosyltransferase II